MKTETIFIFKGEDSPMKSRNQYKTKQRDLIISCLRNNKAEHITVDKIMGYLKAQGASVGQTTIYRNLDKLVEDGIVLKYAADEGRGSCYQYVEQAGRCPTFYHLVCIDCGEMTHLQCSFLDELSEHIHVGHQFSLDKFKTVLYGHCNTCTVAE